jgi:hypothetical protein
MIRFLIFLMGVVLIALFLTNKEDHVYLKDNLKGLKKNVHW